MRVRNRTKLVSNEELCALRESLQNEMPKIKGGSQILVCFGGSCLASGAQQVHDALEAELREAGFDSQVALVPTGCMGPCVAGPVVLMGVDQTFYQGVTAADAAEIVASHVAKGVQVERLLVADSAGRTQASAANWCAPRV